MYCHYDGGDKHENCVCGDYEIRRHINLDRNPFILCNFVLRCSSVSTLLFLSALSTGLISSL